MCWSTPAFPRGREHVASTPVKGTSPKIMGSMIGFVLVASTWALSGPVVQGCEKALIGPLPFFLFCSILMNFVFFIRFNRSEQWSKREDSSKRNMCDRTIKTIITMYVVLCMNTSFWSVFT